MDSESRKWIIGTGLLVFAVVVAMTLLFMDPIRQWPEYYLFADARGWQGVPNAQNVLSNIPFLLVGLLGMIVVIRHRDTWPGKRVVDSAELGIFVVLFLATMLLFFGSAYFHLAPDANRLAWDRYTVLLTMLPLICTVAADRLDTRTGCMLVGPLILLGIGSVIAWQMTGDLRFYGFMQFYSAFAAVILMVLLPSRYSHPQFVYAILAIFVVAKLAEHYDREIFEIMDGVIGGHAVKHVFSAMAVWLALQWVSTRELLR